jgi:hypothetical protein
MLIPNADRAVVDMHKLLDYVLNPTHERGLHKARLFAAVFGLTAADAVAFREYRLQVVKTHDAQLGDQLRHGQMYRIDLTMTWNSVSENVRTTWIVRQGEDFPRLVSCFVKRKRR